MHSIYIANAPIIEQVLYIDNYELFNILCGLSMLNQKHVYMHSLALLLCKFLEGA